MKKQKAESRKQTSDTPEKLVRTMLAYIAACQPGSVRIETDKARRSFEARAAKLFPKNHT